MIFYAIYFVKNNLYYYFYPYCISFEFRKEALPVAENPEIEKRMYNFVRGATLLSMPK